MLKVWVKIKSMLKEYEFYYGSVLARLISKCNQSIEVKTYASKSNSSFVLNDCVGLYIKFSTHRLSPWRFTFQKDHQDEFSEMKSELDDVFLILVCETDGIVALSFSEVKSILDENHLATEWVSVTRRKREQYTVKGSDGTLDFKVAESDFPMKVIDSLDAVKDKSSETVLTSVTSGDSLNKGPLLRRIMPKKLREIIYERGTQKVRS